MRGLSKKRLREWENTIEHKYKRKKGLKLLERMNECIHVGENCDSIDGDYMPVHPMTGETKHDLFMKFIITNNPNLKLSRGE